MVLPKLVGVVDERRLKQALDELYAALEEISVRPVAVLGLRILPRGVRLELFRPEGVSDEFTRALLEALDRKEVIQLLQPPAGPGPQ